MVNEWDSPSWQSSSYSDGGLVGRCIIRGPIPACFPPTQLYTTLPSICKCQIFTVTPKVNVEFCFQAGVRVEGTCGERRARDCCRMDVMEQQHTEATRNSVRRNCDFCVTKKVRRPTLYGDPTKSSHPKTYIGISFVPVSLVVSMSQKLYTFTSWVGVRLLSAWF